MQPSALVAAVLVSGNYSSGTRGRVVSTTALLHYYTDSIICSSGRGNHVLHWITCQI